MTFTTLTFAVFFVTFFALYWGFRRRRPQNALVVAASYFFYGWWDWRFCALMAGSSLVDYCGSLAIASTERPQLRRLWLWLPLGFNLAVLGFFKYYNFFASSFADLAHQVGWRMNPFTLNVVLPVGLSFYTFQAMSYTIDVYRRQLVPTRSLIDYMAFVSFFPQLVAGPIERATALLPQFQQDRVFDEDAARDGCRQALWGFFKKIALADNLGVIVDRVYGTPLQSHGGELIVATLFFAFQIYCDFSAYSDIAIGTAKMLGIRLMRNFAYPYFSQDVAEFWRRWHISLSTWFRDYVFVPLGGSRVPASILSLNVIITFTISGLWHGAAWNFIAWGAANGLLVLFVVLVAKPPRRSVDQPPAGDGSSGAPLFPSPIVFARIVLTFCVLCATWVLFRAPSLAEALAVFRKAATDADVGRVAWDMIFRHSWLCALLMIFVMTEWVQRRHPHPLVFPSWAPLPVRWALYTAMIWLTFLAMPVEPAGFIYFQF